MPTMKSLGLTTGLPHVDRHHEKCRSMRSPISLMHRGAKSAWQRVRWMILTADAIRFHLSSAKRRLPKYALITYTSAHGEARRRSECWWPSTESLA